VFGMKSTKISCVSAFQLTLCTIFKS